MRETIVSDTYAHLLQPDTLLPSRFPAHVRSLAQASAGYRASSRSIEQKAARNIPVMARRAFL